MVNAATLHATAWRERWTGLRGWFLSTGHEPPQAELLRARARSAIPQLLGVIATINEKRGGRNDGEAHRLARASFALNPARHFSMNTDADADFPASTSWADAPPLVVHPRLREYGEAAPRGPLARVRDRAAERHLLSLQIGEESRQVEAAREPGAERDLAAIAIDRLEQLQLIARDADGIRTLPALARFKLGEVAILEPSGARAPATADAFGLHSPGTM